MTGKSMLIPVERIERAIHEIRGQRVVLSHDLAELYGVTVKRLNEQVRRNIERFPRDFIFHLSGEEAADMRSQIATSIFGPESSSQNVALKPGWGGRRHLPFAFTEHGAVMAAKILKSRRAVEVSVFVVRAFVEMRQMVATHRELALKLAELESKVTMHDKHIATLFAAIRKLILG